MNSAAFKNLRNLRIELSKFNDAFCEEIAKSSIVKQSERWWLRGAEVTDSRAVILAASPFIRRLQEFCIQGPCLTETSIETLLSAGVKLGLPMTDQLEITKEAAKKRNPKENVQRQKHKK